MANKRHYSSKLDKDKVLLTYDEEPLPKLSVEPKLKSKGPKQKFTNFLALFN
jgi:hypothetical protein